MKIPSGMRRIDKHEAISKTDIYETGSERHAVADTLEVSKWVGKTIISCASYHSGESYGTDWQILRQIDSPWISVKERFPSEHGQCAMKVEGNTFLGRWNGHRFITLTTDCTTGKVTHWMPIPELPKPAVIPPITIQGGSRTHELIFNKDGSIKAGCVTIDKEKMKEIIEHWKKEQE